MINLSRTGRVEDKGKTERKPGIFYFVFEISIY